ncbi:MAG: hypothetical protein J0M08_01665 [Bacteroidetes bacterium]|nr:hypothetical protein [Bacteroidota bacterium]
MMLKGKTTQIVNLILALLSAVVFLVLGILFAFTNVFQDLWIKEYRLFFGIIILTYCILKFYRFYLKVKEYQEEYVEIN